MVIRTGFDVELGSAEKKQRKPEESPLRCLVLAGLSDQAHDSKELFTQRLELDQLDALMRRMAPTFSDPNAPQAARRRYTLAGLDDFHPDALVENVESLAEVVELGAALEDPARHEAALLRLAEITGIDPKTERAASAALAATSETEAREGDRQTFERLLGRPRSDEAPTTAKLTVEALIKQALESETTRAPAPRAESAEQQLAALFEQRLRAILAEPCFRGLERSWRSLHWLLSRVEDDCAQVFVLDIDKPTLIAHLAEFAGALDQSPLHRIIAGGDQAWDLVIGDYSFGLDARDILALASLGALASRAKAPFLSHGELALAGCTNGNAVDEPWNWCVPDDERGRLWAEFRRHPAAAWVGLATPRFVLRYPYGRKNDPIDGRAFEELPPRPATEDFVWGNPAFLSALLLLELHEDGAFEWPSARGGEVLDLPTPLFFDGSGEAMQPPLEFLLDERARTTAARQGLIVFASGRNTNKIRAGAVGAVG